MPQTFAEIEQQAKADSERIAAEAHRDFERIAAEASRALTPKEFLGVSLCRRQRSPQSPTASSRTRRHPPTR